MPSPIVCALGVLLLATNSFAANAPVTSAQIALYQGADREKILIEGAKREGQFTLYTSHTWFKTFVKEFEKKYPFVRATEWRNDSKNVIRKVLEEVKAGPDARRRCRNHRRRLGCVEARRDCSRSTFRPKRATIRMSSSREAKADSSICRTGRPTTAWVSTPKSSRPASAPRSLKDLLDPKWKGKMAITNTTTGARWIGNVHRIAGTGVARQVGRSGDQPPGYGARRR